MASLKALLHNPIFYCYCQVLFVQDRLCKYLLLLCPILTISMIFPLVIAASFTIAVIRTVFIMMAEDWLTAHIVITWSYISALATKDCLSSFRDVSCSKVMTYLSKEVAAVEVSPEDDMSRATAMSSLCTASSKRPIKEPVENAQAYVEPRNTDLLGG